jgi:hypothetical protein
MPLQVQDDFVFHECLPQDSVKKLLNGQFVAAHLPWSKKLEQVIEDITPTRRVKHVLMYRDPRDTFVSYMKYVTNSPSYQRTPRARARQNFMREKPPRFWKPQRFGSKHSSENRYLSEHPYVN